MKNCSILKTYDRDLLAVKDEAEGCGGKVVEIR